ncbi:MAG: zinc ribbon domain-containing protein, partial [Candidatus Hodarchaeales archaeon]
RTCPECHYPNASDAIFCENCGQKFGVRGQKIVTGGQLKDRIIQQSIDHVYMASFIVIYTFLGGLGFILSPVYAPNVLDNLARLTMSFGILLVPAIVLALIAGVILNSFTKDMKSFEFKYKKSFEFKYNQVLNHFEEMVTWGFLYAFLSSVIFGFLALMGLTWCLPAALLILLTSFIWLLIMHDKKPQGIPYLTLLKVKRTFGGFVQDQLMKINLIGGTMIVVLVVIWNFYLYSLLSGTQVSFEGAIIVSILQIIALFLVLNGYLMMYYYSWSSVNRYILREVEQRIR